MARYAYDVNTTQRYIDVHKQFQGGLKTVDTDDALGAVFLRQAENVSLSEFGFIEKRYGTYENFKIAKQGELQGYWEFLGYIIYVVNGIFYYYKDGTDTPVLTTSILKETEDLDSENYEKNWRYPNVLPESFQTTRDMNGVNINNVLYIFTGDYPIYVSEIKNTLKFYWFSSSIPTYDEIVVTGHNILEENFEEVYGFSGDYYHLSNSDNEDLYSEGSVNPLTFESKKTSFYPRIPFVSNEGVEGVLNFDIAYQYNSFIEDATVKLRIDELSYATSNIGLNPLDFIKIDPEFFTHNALNNVPNDVTKTYNSDDTNTIDINDVKNFEPNYIKVPGAGNQIIYTKEVKQITSAEPARNSFYNINHTYVQLPLDFLKADKEYKLSIFSKKDTNIPSQRLHFQDEIVDHNNQFLYEFEDDYPLSGSPVGEWSNRFFGVALYPIYGSTTPDLQKSQTNRVELSHIIGTGGININNGYFNFTPNENHIAALKDPEVIGVLVHIKSPYLTYRNGDEIIEEYMYEAYVNNTWSNFTTTSNDMENPNYSYRTKVLGTALLYTTEEITGSPETKFGNLLKIQLRNLISGTYDFKVKGSIVEMDDSTLLDPPQVLKNFEIYIRNVPILPEKLQDYPGSEGVAVKPQAIWKCNKVIEHFGKLMIWGSEEMPTAVFYSFPDRPTYFPTYFYLDFTNDENNPIESVVPYMNVLIVQTEDRTWGIRGNSGIIDAPAPYIPFSINPSMGTIAYKSVRAVRNKLFFLSKQGVASLNSLYAVDEMYNVKFEDLNVRNIVPQDTKAVGIQYDNQYWLNFPKYGITLRWYIDKSAWVMDRFGSYVDELGNVVTKVGAWNQFNGVFKWQIKNGKLEFISYPSRFTTDDTLSIYKIGIDYSLPYDLGKTYAAKLETSFLNQNYPFHPKNYKEAKLDFTLQNEYNLSRDALYTMDLNEDIDGSVHKIDNISLIRNHTYRIYYKFGTFEIENLDGGSFVGSISASYDGGLFDSLLIGSDVINGYFFDLQIANNAVTSVMIVNAEDNQTDYLSGEDITITELGNGDYSVQFYTPNHLNGLYDILIEGNYQFYDGGAVMYDVTYDDSLTFQTWVISEEQTLNLDNIQSYDQSKADVAFDLKGRLGEWVFGTSDFGDKVTAVKTIKLSGRGYNSKIYMEDYTNSKWTLESLGITYKMKRARNR
jgi:hypothetical protein